MKSPPYRNVFKHSSSTKTFSPLACLHLSTAQYHSVQKQYTSLAISLWATIEHGQTALDTETINIVDPTQTPRNRGARQEISHLRILLFKPHTSQPVLAILAWYQHVAGLSYPVLEHRPFTMYHINSLWLDNLVRLLKKYNV